MTKSGELYELGAKQIIDKKYAEAVRSLSEAHSLDPNYADINELLSIAYTQLGVEQTNSYNPFESAKPDMDIYNKAAENLRKAIEIDPNNTGAKKNLSFLIAAWGRSIVMNFPHCCYDDAMKMLKEAVDLDPENADTKLLFSTVTCMKLASDKLREENDEEAIINFKKALEVDPDIQADLCAVIHTEIAKA